MGKRRPQKPKRRVQDIAKERGVYAIRRTLAEGSEEVLEPLYEILPPYLEGAKGRIFTQETLGVTVVGASRFKDNHFDKGPATAQVLEQVPSADSFISAKIGSIALFGSGSRMNKLGFCLQSTSLQAENEALRDVYKNLGFPLHVPWYEKEGFVPHCSVAILYTDQIGRFSNDDILDRLDKSIGIREQEIVLAPVARN